MKIITLIKILATLALIDWTFHFLSTTMTPGEVIKTSLLFIVSGIMINMLQRQIKQVAGHKFQKVKRLTTILSYIGAMIGLEYIMIHLGIRYDHMNKLSHAMYILHLMLWVLIGDTTTLFVTMMINKIKEEKQRGIE